MQQRKILVTSSLPYANGELHLGHIIETIQTDIWARYQRSRGHHCYYICGSDAHGTPIMIRAEKEGISPEELVKRTREEHLSTYKRFLIDFNYFHTTHSPENKRWTEIIYTRLQQKGDIFRKVIEQAYDPVKQMFLPDRFVKGECPRCGAVDQYGDSCEVCGATYSPVELKNPRSVLSGETPVRKSSEHLFFNLPHYAELLKDWLHQGNHVQKSIAHKLNEWFDQGLQSWDISRDAPYFGFPIPGVENKYFYVWLDAPIGYISSFSRYCEEHPEVDFESFFEKNTDTELHHFIGKDVVYFHTLFWPAMLNGAGFRMPTSVHVHGFLTVNGQKMSKSRGTFIKASDYLQYLDPEYLRYYFASKLNNTVEDIDMNLVDFKQKVNSDLVGKLANIASRTAGFVVNKNQGRLGKIIMDKVLYGEFVRAADMIAGYYENRQFAHAMREIMRLADLANQFVAKMEPWKLAKQEGQDMEVQNICTLAINLFRLLVIYIQPVLPEFSKKVAAFLNVSDFIWSDHAIPLLDHVINAYPLLINRIEDDKIMSLQNPVVSEESPSKEVEKNKTETVLEPITVSIDEFAKIDLRVARIVLAEEVPEADKLIKLQLDVGELGKRQVFAGIKSSFKPEELVDQLVLCIVNLAPRKMRFGLSEGMLLVASDGSGKVHLMQPQSGALPGMRVK